MKKALLLLACGAFMMSANATTVVDVTFDGNSQWADYSATQGWWQMLNQSSEWSCSVSTDNDPRNEGTFVMSDLDLDYTLLIQNGVEIDYSDVTATVTNNAGVITCVAYFVDGAADTEYKVIMVYGTRAIIGSGSCGANLIWSLNDEGVLTISGNGEMYSYWDWNESPFYHNENIKKIVLDEGVTTIGDYAFYDCSGLTSIEMPESVTNIGHYAFRGCIYEA